MTRLLRFIRLRPADQALVIEAAILLCVAEALLRVLKFPRIARSLGRHMAERSGANGHGMKERGDRVGWAVNGVAKLLPWKPVCLPQAVAAQWMLRRRRIPSTLHMGIDPRGGYDAHAWVSVGDRVVTGGPGTDRFAVVSTFG